MRTELPEWTSITPVPAVRATEQGRTSVLMRAGLVGGLTDGPEIALQLADEPMVILSPAVAAQIVGALRLALAELDATRGTCFENL